jgi:ABC-type lipoprotein export system ATPase subunit
MDKDWTRIRREIIGMVFQAFYLIPGLTARENIALPLALQGNEGPKVDRRVTESLEAVGLGHRADHKTNELSGGEQQRVAIARALVHRPRLILADEPTGNLDSTNGQQIMTLLRSLSRRFGQTVIMATHSDLAIQAADRVYAMRDGRLESRPS